MFGKKGLSKPVKSVQEDAPKAAKNKAEEEAVPENALSFSEESVTPGKKPEPSIEEMEQSIKSIMHKEGDMIDQGHTPLEQEQEQDETPQKQVVSEPKKQDTAPKKPLPEMDAKELQDKVKASFDIEDDQEGQQPVTPKQDAVNVRLRRARTRIWSDLRDGIDLKSLSKMDAKEAQEEIRSAVNEIVRFRGLDLTPTEVSTIAKECTDDMLGYGPLETLLERDDIADIMINGPDTTYIEVGGRIERADIQFRDNQHLTTICQRIVSAIGRRVDESSPVCDARLHDGSRVNVIIPPLAIDGTCLTIRKFKKDKLTLDKLVGFGSLTPACAKMIMAIGRSRVNVLVSGGTGSGKTTMLNCLTRYIDAGERIITCEDAAELQLQQPHTVRLETRPPNLEGAGEITMRDLVKNCLRMRPERIIVGEVRGPEAFDLLQAMNTGHDGSMGTVHANNPREAISRMENMIAMGGLNLPAKAVREQIASAVNVIIQVQRLRDGSRKVTHISEITGMEGEIVTMQDLFKLEYLGEEEDGSLLTRLSSSGLRPQFYDKARQYGCHDMVMEAIDEAYDKERAAE